MNDTKKKPETNERRKKIEIIMKRRDKHKENTEATPIISH